MLQHLCLNFKDKVEFVYCFSVFKDLHGMISDDIHFAKFFTTVGGCDLCLAEMGEADSLSCGFHRHMLLLEVNDAWVEVFKGLSKEGPSCFA